MKFSNEDMIISNDGCSNENNNDSSSNMAVSGNYSGDDNKKEPHGRKSEEITAEIITAKNRNGQTKTNKLYWIGEYQRFTSACIFNK